VGAGGSSAGGVPHSFGRRSGTSNSSSRSGWSSRPRYLLNHRWRVSRQLDHWLERIGQAIQRQQAGQEQPRAEFADYVRELQRIALGQDTSGSARDRLGALKELLKLERRGSSSYLEASSADERELQRRWAQVHQADERKRLSSLEQRHGSGD
jgi:hypothetical protein